MTASTDIFHATQHNFETEVLEASFTTPVLVDFWAPWCGPCKTLMPMLDRIVTEAKGTVKLAKVNTDEEMALAGSFGIRSLPTVVLFKDGRPVDGFMGAQPEGAVRALLAKHVGAAPAEAALAPAGRRRRRPAAAGLRLQLVCPGQFLRRRHRRSQLSASVGRRHHGR